MPTVTIVIRAYVHEDDLERYYAEYPELAVIDERVAGATLLREAVAALEWELASVIDDTFTQEPNSVSVAC